MVSDSFNKRTRDPLIERLPADIEREVLTFARYPFERAPTIVSTLASVYLGAG